MRATLLGKIGGRQRVTAGAECGTQVAALPWRRGERSVEIMLITSRDTGRWVLPKGWPEAGETLWDAAAREAVEEAGLSGEVSSHEAGRYHYDKVRRSGDVVPCEVLVYPLEVEEIAETWPERKQRKRRWFAPEDAARCVQESELAELLAEFHGIAPGSEASGSATAQQSNPQN